MIISLKPWHGACILGWIMFITFQCVYGINAKFSQDPWCLTKHDGGLQDWYTYICIGNTGGFLIIWVILIARFRQAKHSRLGNLDQYLAYLNVVTIGLISSVLMLTIGWGKFCADYFGLLNIYLYLSVLKSIYFFFSLGLRLLRSYGANGSRRAL